MTERACVRGRDGRFVGAGRREDGKGPAGARAGKGRGGWTAAKEAIFFRELATVCNVSSALRACAMFRSKSEVYDRRRADPQFRAKWDDSIDEGYAMLDLEMLERARSGDRRPAPETEVEKRLRQVPTALGLQLLKLYHARKARPAPAGAAERRAASGRPVDGAALRREFDQMLSDYNRRMGGNG